MDAHEAVLNVADRVSQSKPTRVRLCDMTDEEVLLKLTGADETEAETETKRKREYEEVEEVADEVKAMLVSSMQSRIKRRRTEMEEAGAPEQDIEKMEDEMYRSTEDIIFRISNLGDEPRDFPPEIWTIIADALEEEFVPRLALINRQARSVVVTYVKKLEENNRIQWNPNGPVRQAHAHFLFRSPFWHMFFDKEPLKVKVAILIAKYGTVPRKIKERLLSSYSALNVLETFESLHDRNSRLRVLWPNATCIELFLWKDANHYDLYGIRVYLTLPSVFPGVVESFEELITKIHAAQRKIGIQSDLQKPSNRPIARWYTVDNRAMPPIILRIGEDAFEVYVERKVKFPRWFYRNLKEISAEGAVFSGDTVYEGRLETQAATTPFLSDPLTVDKFVEEFNEDTWEVMDNIDDFFWTRGNSDAT